MQDYLSIFLGTQARIFIIRCLTARKLPPPLRINCSSPNKKRDQFQPFPNRTDCHTEHITKLHGLWPSLFLKQLISEPEIRKKSLTMLIFMQLSSEHMVPRGQKSQYSINMFYLIFYQIGQIHSSELCIMNNVSNIFILFKKI